MNKPSFAVVILGLVMVVYPQRSSRIDLLRFELMPATRFPLLAFFVLSFGVNPRKIEKVGGLLRRLEDISTHSFAKSILVFPRACHSGSILTSILDPGFEFLIPGVCTDTINDANH